MKKLPDFIPEASWKMRDQLGCKMLLLAILRTAILDMSRPCRFKGQKDLNEAQFKKAYNAARENAYPRFLPHESVHAWSWFFSESSAFVTSYISIMKHLGQDPWNARKYKHTLSMAKYFLQKDAKEKEEEECQQKSLVEPLPQSVNLLIQS